MSRASTFEVLRSADICCVAATFAWGTGGLRKLAVSGLLEGVSLNDERTVSSPGV